MEALLQQLGACKSLLAALRGRPGFNKASSCETLKIQRNMRMLALSTHELGQVATAIQDAGFSDVDYSALLDTLGDIVGDVQPACKASRSSTQDFTELGKYLTQRCLDALNQGSLAVFLTISFVWACGARASRRAR